MTPNPLIQQIYRAIEHLLNAPQGTLSDPQQDGIRLILCHVQQLERLCQEQASEIFRMTTNFAYEFCTLLSTVIVYSLMLLKGYNGAVSPLHVAQLQTIYQAGYELLVNIEYVDLYAKIG